MLNRNNTQQQPQQRRGGIQSSSISDKERRLQELQYEQYQLQQQVALEKYASQYETVIQWPAQIVNGNNQQQSSSLLRTSKDLIQHRLIENGILYDIPITTTELAKQCNQCIADLHRTECYDAIQIDIGVPYKTNTETKTDDTTTSSTKRNTTQQDSDSPSTGSKSSSSNGDNNNNNDKTIRVTLHEKKWYRFHAGAGLKSSASNADVFNTSTTTFGNSDSSTTQFIPLAEIDISAGLRNLTGYCDKTDVQYTMDTKGISSWSLVHSRPLYSLLPNGTAIQDTILGQKKGSQYEFAMKAILDTIDYEYIRGYQEYQRLVSFCICNTHNVNQSSSTAISVSGITKQNWFTSLEWKWLYRDIIPRRSTVTPYQFDTSNAVLQMAGPSMKHSIVATIQYTSPEIFGATTNDDDERFGTSNPSAPMQVKNPSLPTEGYIINNITELALPPGDVGYIKTQVTATNHIPLSSFVSFHTNISLGYIRALSYGGLLHNNNNNTANNIHCSDRFYLGGTNSFRGYVPGGIGPRGFVSTTNSRTGKAGNALGGDFYYTTTLMASTALPDTVPVVSDYLAGFGIRLFAFTTVGTLTNIATLLRNPKYYNYNHPVPSQQQPHQLSSSSPPSTIRYGSLVNDIVYSSRVSTGIGLTTTVFGPKVEVSYSIPLRYGPYDGRKLFQFGMSVSL